MDIMDTLYGPLPKSYCLYFYYLSIIGFVLLVLSVSGSVIIALSKPRGAYFYISSLMIAISYLIFYFQNRLLHTMCIHSL